MTAANMSDKNKVQAVRYIFCTKIRTKRRIIGSQSRRESNRLNVELEHIFMSYMISFFNVKLERVFFRISEP
jgi:hypothetical protein